MTVNRELDELKDQLSGIDPTLVDALVIPAGARSTINSKGCGRAFTAHKWLETRLRTVNCNEPSTSFTRKGFAGAAH